MCTYWCAKVDKPLACKFANAMFAATVISKCANCLDIHYLYHFLPNGCSIGTTDWSGKLSMPDDMIDVTWIALNN